MGEAELLEKLRKIEALHAGATSDGEREAARAAAERIRARLAEARVHEADIVMVYTLPDPWTRKLFVALCRRYGLRPFGARDSVPLRCKSWRLRRSKKRRYGPSSMRSRRS